MGFWGFGFFWGGRTSGQKSVLTAIQNWGQRSDPKLCEIQVPGSLKEAWSFNRGTGDHHHLSIHPRRILGEIKRMQLSLLLISISAWSYQQQFFKPSMKYSEMNLVNQEAFGFFFFHLVLTVKQLEDKCVNHKMYYSCLASCNRAFNLSYLSQNEQLS